MLSREIVVFLSRPQWVKTTNGSIMCMKVRRQNTRCTRSPGALAPVTNGTACRTASIWETVFWVMQLCVPVCGTCTCLTVVWRLYVQIIGITIIVGMGSHNITWAVIICLTCRYLLVALSVIFYFVICKHIIMICIFNISLKIATIWILESFIDCKPTLV